MVLLSRVAESLFWMGRSVERAENVARLLDVAYHGRLEPFGDGDLLGATNTWQALISTLGLDAAYSSLYDKVSEDRVIEFLTVSSLNASSIVSCVTAARENARSVRDHLSSETWVAVNKLHHTTARGNLHLIMADGLYDFCDSIRQGAGLFHGTASSTQLHDEGWNWMRSGIYLERADMVTRIVDSKYHLLMSSLDEVGGPIDRHQWAAVLRSVSGYEAFRRTHAEGIEASSVIEFLVLDNEFPRSVRRCVDGLLQSLAAATMGAQPKLRNPSMRLVTDMQNRLQYESAETLVGAGLHEYLAEVQRTLAAVTESVSGAFFWATFRAA